MWLKLPFVSIPKPHVSRHNFRKCLNICSNSILICKCKRFSAFTALGASHYVMTYQYTYTAKLIKGCNVTLGIDYIKSRVADISPPVLAKVHGINDCQNWNITPVTDVTFESKLFRV